MAIRDWPARWSSLTDACKRMGATGEFNGSNDLELPRVVEPPATEDEVSRVEVRLGATLPPSLREVILGYSKRVDIGWFLPEQVKPPKPFDQIFCGTMHWDLDELLELEGTRKSWIENCYPNSSDPYDAVWHGKLSFLAVGNGDMHAIELDPKVERIIYLSHDGGDGHGYVIAQNFMEYVDRLSQLGSPGGEDWQWLPFTDSPTSGIEPENAHARAWRSWFGLP